VKLQVKHNKRKGKTITLTKDGECSITFEHIENSLEHWVTLTYIINSLSVETRTAVCIIN